MTILLALLLLSPATSTGSPSATQTSRAASHEQASEKLPDLKPILDGCVRWLRGQFQLETGSYGSLEETAWVLRGLAKSHRHYARHDGPFVAGALDFLIALQGADGAIATPDADPQRKFGQTLYAMKALAEFDDPKSRTAYEKAKAFFPGVPMGKTSKINADNAEEWAREWLADMQPGGYWEKVDLDGPGGPSLIETATALAELSEIRALLQVSEEPQPASSLPEFSAADRVSSLEALERGALFLLGQAGTGEAMPLGTFGADGKPDAGLTALALAALAGLPEQAAAMTSKHVEAGLEWLASKQHENGSIHDGKLANYTTSVAIMAFAKHGDERWKPVIARAKDFLIMLQADEGEGYSEGDIYYGGIGYGGDERPDLSNLHMALEALRSAGVDKDSPTFKRALKFLERCQNRSESNDTEITTKGTVVVSGDDGGSGYMPGDSPAGFVQLADGRQVPRSYGSMTYALLKSYLFAGLEPEDARLEAAWEWLKEHYTLDVNPGFEHSSDPRAAYQGLFYYFLTMAQALDLYGVEIIPVGEREHAWRSELCGRLVAMQDRAEGYWVNHNASRWWEGNPLIATAYGLLAIEAALPAR